MAVLKDLIVHGASRFLNGANFNTINAESIGADAGIFNKLVATSLDAKTATIDDLTAKNATVTALLDVQGELHTNSWSNANIATIDGSFYISPTSSSADGSDVDASGYTPTGTITYNNGNYTKLVVTGTFNTSQLNLGDATNVAWPANSYVIITGDVLVGNEWYPLGTIRGKLQSQLAANANSKTITIIPIGVVIIDGDVANTSLTDGHGLKPQTLEAIRIASSTAVNGSTTLKMRKIKVSMTSYGGTYQSPIGIFMTAMGSNKKTFLDIYGGSNNTTTIPSGSGALAKPVLRIGNLSGLPKVGTVTPSGWGIYTTNGFFSGTVVAKQGIIGSGETAWTIGSGNGTGSVSYIYAPTTGPTSKTANTVGMYIGTDGINNFNTSSQYVRIYNGKIYAQGAEIAGAIAANSLNVGSSSDSNHLIYSGGTIDLSTDWLKFDSSTQTVSIGKKINNNSMQTKIDNDTFWIGNELNSLAFIGNENIEIIDTFVSDGEQNEFTLSSPVAEGSSITISPSSVVVSRNDQTLTVTSGLPAFGESFTCTYTPDNLITSYTFGIRGSNSSSSTGHYSFATGKATVASGAYSHVEGYESKALGSYSHAEGHLTKASGVASHAEGFYAVASGYESHAEGVSTTASGEQSHAEGWSTIASGDASHAEGYDTRASKDYSHSEGYYTTAYGIASHAEGDNTTASGWASHAEGIDTVASGRASSASGIHTNASDFFGSANGTLTKARAGQFVIGVANIEDTGSGGNIPYTSVQTVDLGQYAFIIGNGHISNDSYLLSIDDESKITRSNALTVDWNGTITANGYICNNIGGNSTQTHGNVIHTWFQNHKTTIARNALLSYWSSAYGNGSQYFGYFLNGYDTSPYGGFFVCHYTTPWYVGISNGNFTQYELTRTATSSRKTKENIKLMKDDEAKKLYNLDVISFDYKKEYEEGKKNQFGLIAEDCDKIIPYVVCKPDNNENSTWGIDYTKFVPYLIKNLQLHEETIEKLNGTVQQLMNRVDKLESEIKTLKSQ